MSLRIVLLAALAAASFAISPAASAQAPKLSLTTPAPARQTVGQQLTRLDARIDRELAQGRISQDDATRAHREVNRIQDEASADRVSHGGHLTVADRFDLEAQVDQLKAELHRERVKGAGEPAH